MYEGREASCSCKGTFGDANIFEPLLNTLTDGHDYYLSIQLPYLSYAGLTETLVNDNFQ